MRSWCASVVRRKGISPVMSGSESESPGLLSMLNIMYLHTEHVKGTGYGGVSTTK